MTPSLSEQCFPCPSHCRSMHQLVLLVPYFAHLLSSHLHLSPIPLCQVSESSNDTSTFSFLLISSLSIYPFQTPPQLLLLLPVLLFTITTLSCLIPQKCLLLAKIHFVNSRESPPLSSVIALLRLSSSLSPLTPLSSLYSPPLAFPTLPDCPSLQQQITKKNLTKIVIY